MRRQQWSFAVPTLLFYLSTFVFSDSNNGNGSQAEISINFLQSAKKEDLFNWMVKIRRAIHENPELGFEEFETSRLIRDELEKLGIPYTHPLAVTGIVGSIGTGNPPFVAIRADMDALPIEEKVEWKHKSKFPGKMHACGHDAHVAMLLGAAKLLQEHRNELQGTVLLVFQPAEEGGGGAKRMLDAGILEGVDAIFGLHVSPIHPVGTVAIRPGPILAGSGFFSAQISGKGGHAAIPQNTIDPILAASSIIVSLQHLVSREADPLDSQVVTVSKFQGGNAFNVIPDSVTIGYCETSGRSKVQCHFFSIAEHMVGAKKILERKPTMGAEDFSFFAEAVPGYFYFVGMANDTRGGTVLPHSPFFELNEDVLPYGAALHASLAATYLLRLHKKSNARETQFHDEL
ncbi:unnamed protein product [Cuscuta campestris]|uniref:Peptidase M20 dimerisation domain-containing protein n=1 Tax=Cuscuta campestris TaxID=132261 RepID=A0A484LD95_9ASTE|nr:unnamed protein product [Cuscuta campestris]